MVNSYTSNWCKTDIGVPQGSVIAPILFILFVRDIATSFPKHIKFADDLTVWVRHTNIKTAASLLEGQLTTLVKWTNKWRLIINVTKTEVICFSSYTHHDVSVKLGPTTLNQVTHKACLGVIMDENLTFQHHIKSARGRALAAAYRLSNFLHECGGVRTYVGSNLYRSYVRPHMEFAAPVWASSSNKVDIIPLEQVQRLCLLRITGCLRSTATSAMEVITGIPPLRLRIDEVCMQELVRIAAKPNHHRLKKSFCLDKDYRARSSSTTPAHCLWRTINTIQPQLDLFNIEEELRYHENFHAPMPITPNLIAWEGLGSSGTRSTEEAEKACQLAVNHIKQVKGVLAFTDGSADPNPGPTGAGAAIYLDGLNSEPVLLHKGVSKTSSSYMGEVVAILIALEYLVNCSRNFELITIFTDCQSALTSIIDSNAHNRIPEIRDIQIQANLLLSKGTPINITWVAGHVGLTGNELADKQAKLGVNLAKSENLQTTISKSLVKTTIRRHIQDLWQNKWDIENEARIAHDITPDIGAKPRPSPKTRKADIAFNHLLNGHTLLQDHQYRIGQSNNNSPNCECGQDRETIDHYLLKCPLHTEARNIMLSNISAALAEQDPPIKVNYADTAFLLGTNNFLAGDTRRSILKAVTGFLISTKCRP